VNIWNFTQQIEKPEGLSIEKTKSKSKLREDKGTLFGQGQTRNRICISEMKAWLKLPSNCNGKWSSTTSIGLIHCLARIIDSWLKAESI
jgi:hypothetical protein